jgi:ATP-dependent helicase HrpB
MLDLRAMGIDELVWLDSPPQNSRHAAGELLRRLGALDASGALTPIGEEMARYPLHPRLARLAIEARKRGAARDGCALAALLSAGARIAGDAKGSGPSDLLLLLESEWDPQARRIFQQLWRGGTGRGGDQAALLIAILTAFPDRVAKRRQGMELMLSSGGSARLAPSSVVHVPLMVAVDIEERRERGLPLVRLASAIEPEWLLDLYPDQLEERDTLEWNRTAERVEASAALVYGSLVLEESRDRAPDPEGAARLLFERAMEAGVARFADPDQIEEYLARVDFARQHADLPRPDVARALESLCAGLRSFQELAGAGLLQTLERQLPAAASRTLEEVAPAGLRLPSGRRVKIRYTRDQPPWAASRLQDFFGMQQTPLVARGKVPLVLHLLAPNQRPVQMTTDLAGFWQRLYPQVRRELSRRYPRHRWPENPRLDE